MEAEECPRWQLRKWRSRRWLEDQTTTLRRWILDSKLEAHRRQPRFDLRTSKVGIRVGRQTLDRQKDLGWQRRTRPPLEWKRTDGASTKPLMPLRPRM